MRRGRSRILYCQTTPQRRLRRWRLCCGAVCCSSLARSPIHRVNALEKQHVTPGTSCVADTNFLRSNMSEKKQLLDLPNRWISMDPDSDSVMTYAPQGNPAPLTVSLPGKDPKLASLEIVITNETDNPVTVSSISITFNVGSSNALMQTTQGVNYAVSDGQSWNVTPPPSPVSSGEATYKLGPKVGSSVTLPSNGSVVLQLYQFQTILQPSSVTVTVKESLVNLDPAFAYFQITTFSDSFYFNSLSVTVADGSSYAPVAQVPLNTRVTLLWNASVMEITAFDVFQSTAAGPAPPQKPNKVGEWLSPPLT